MEPALPKVASRGSGKEIFAWALYDWANSAYSTILITVVMSYLTTVVFLDGDGWGPTSYAWGISAAMMLAAVLSPILGALTDANGSKRQWLAMTALGGAAASLLMAVADPGNVALVLACYVVMNLCFELSLGFYNAFLPEIADEDSMNRVSAWGFALGYLGGALALLIALALVIFGQQWGIPDEATALRLGIAVMGLWWGGFSVPTLLILRDRPRATAPKPFGAAMNEAFASVWTTLRNIRRYAMLALFLLGFLLYNEGVQTTISQASTFATKTPELAFSTQELIGLVLMIQFLALPGAILVGWFSDLFGQKPTLLTMLAIWVAVLLTAFCVHSKLGFWVLGGVVAMVMGGTQSVSRAIMGVMTPEKHTGEFFGFFNLSGKATSFLGPFLFGSIYKLTENTRLAIVSLLVFFIVGGLIATKVDIERGRREAAA